MAFSKKIMDDIFEYFQVILTSYKGPEIIKAAIAGDVNLVAKDFYEFYSKDRKLEHDIGKAEFENLAVKYNEELKRAVTVMQESRVQDIDTDGYDPWVESYSSLIRFFDPKHKAEIKYRLYCNLKSEHMAEFMKFFLKQVFKGKIQCPKCKQEASYNTQKKEIICPNCKNEDFYFVIKIHMPVVDKGEQPQEGEQDRLMSEDVVLRRDKLILGFSNKDMLKSVLKILQKIGPKYFSEKIPYLTHPVLPGVGVSLEPNKTETEDYNTASKETEEIITFEHFLTLIIAQNFVGLVKKEHLFVEEILTLWISEQGDSKDLYEKLKKHLIIPLEDSLQKDQKLARLFSEMESIKKDLDSV